ncbi:DUF6547 family protein [Blastopirellula marina]|uniref:Uncharacterized protein n=1 Tax=Blastopirellula marina TaxID=124 RepID=A0A2S8GKT5_9BACT|nr:DUF6547 family protein [Blastopirellula marina]PQO45046.1 hypothetical protein C5Y93_16055 [Blastopirellula marina]
MPRENPAASIPSLPIDVYKKIIDDLVSQTPSISGKLIREEGVYSRGEGEFAKRMNEFITGLSADQRIALEALLTDERCGAIGDVLAMLTWWITCHGLRLSVHGEPMPTELSGMGLHGDYIGRLEGWNWPST